MNTTYGSRQEGWAAKKAAVGTYGCPQAENALRPEIGAQAHFRKPKPPAEYRYDSALSPELNWNGQNSAGEEGEALFSSRGDGVVRFQFRVRVGSMP